MIQITETKKGNFEIYFEKNLILDNLKNIDDNIKIDEAIKRYIEFKNILQNKGIEEFSIDKEKINFKTYYIYKCYSDERGGIDIAHCIHPIMQGLERSTLDFITIEEIEKEY
ncbi:MAG: hypothetical protein ACRCX2_00895 [Paraclostridium sp.]